MVKLQHAVCHSLRAVSARGHMAVISKSPGAVQVAAGILAVGARVANLLTEVYGSKSEYL